MQCLDQFCLKPEAAVLNNAFKAHKRTSRRAIFSSRTASCILFSVLAAKITKSFFGLARDGESEGKTFGCT